MQIQKNHVRSFKLHFRFFKVCIQMCRQTRTLSWTSADKRVESWAWSLVQIEGRSERVFWLQRKRIPAHTGLTNENTGWLMSQKPEAMADFRAGWSSGSCGLQGSWYFLSGCSDICNISFRQRLVSSVGVVWSAAQLEVHACLFASSGREVWCPGLLWVTRNGWGGKGGR